ncbi:MAG: ABC transporter ATP-binding protein, partial [Acidimicrobiales bacterium]
MFGDGAGAVRSALRLLPAVGRGRVAAFGSLLVWSGLNGVAYRIATGALISAVPPAVGLGFDSAAGRRLLGALSVTAMLFLLGRALVPVVALVNGGVSRRFHRAVTRLLMGAACGPETVAHLEDPAVADRMAMARGEQTRVSSTYFVSSLAQVVGTYLGCLASAGVLFTFAWWAPLVVGVGLCAERAWARRELDSVIASLTTSGPELRRTGYFRDLSLSAAPAKEMRVFGLGSWAAGQFRSTWLSAMEPVWRGRRGLGPLAVVAVLAVTVTQGAVAIAVVVAGIDGRISLGDVTVFLGSASAMAAIVWSPESEWQLRTAASSVAQTMSLHEEFAPAGIMAGDQERRPADGLPGVAIRFEGVRFRYPGGQNDVLEGLDLEVPAGRSLALVGINGAGKTTLTKLLAGLYRPTGGAVTVDGVDLNDLDPASWRRRLAVIFQDFTRYEVSAADNVGFGAPTLLGDRDALARAAARAGAAELIDMLPYGWDSVLSRRFPGGTELSGGQWQRIALARCFAAVEAGASVLVLDEPTASLDVRGEAELFDRFLDLTADLTTIVISHRFSTVRRADRIAVIDGGRVTELGSHEELVAAGGHYATMFALQAARLGLGLGLGLG